MQHNDRSPRNSIVIPLIIILLVCVGLPVFSEGVSEEELLCDLASQPDNNPANEEVSKANLNDYVQARVGSGTHNELSVCLSVKSDFNILGIPWERRDIVEIPYKSPDVTEQEKAENPDLLELGYYIRVFQELKAPKGTWGLSPYRPVKMQLVPESVNIESPSSVVDFALTELPSREESVDIRVVTVKVDR